MTGGNTKPLYYFGSVLGFKVAPISIRQVASFPKQMSSRSKSNFSQRNYCHMCMATDKLSIMCDNVVGVVGDGSNVFYMQGRDIP